MALLEVCCGNPESVAAAVGGGARRVELCSALELDGLTPPTEWIRDARTHFPHLTLHVLIRSRAGDFCYSEPEVATLAEQVGSALEAGADGIVVGCLTKDGAVDLPAMRRLVHVVDEWNRSGKTARVTLTFHRAFDVCKRPFEALEQIIGLGCDRILTSGQAATAEAGSALLRELREKAAGRIILLAGGGVTPANAAGILQATGCTEIHASASETVNGKKTTSAAKVAAILQAIEP